MTDQIYTKENGTYLQNNPSWHVEDSAWKATQILKMISRNQLNPKSVAEVGCGAGEILNQLLARMPSDVSFSGYEIATDALKLARQRTKERLEFTQMDFVSVNERFDLLLVIDVFEHVDDYLGFLRACKSKAGKTIFHIPIDISIKSVLRNDLMKGRNTYGHLHYFTKETALATLVDCGYKIIDTFYTAGLIELPVKKFKSKLFVLFLRMISRLNRDVTVKLFGGYSLMVLAE
jgi:SAM-dependent methyltransferase